MLLLLLTRVMWLSLICTVVLSEFTSCWIFRDNNDVRGTDPWLDPTVGAGTASGRESHRRKLREEPSLFPGALDSTLDAPSLKGCPTIVSRQQWGARPPKSKVSLKTPVHLLIIHHTEGNPCSSQAACSREVRRIQNYHMDKRRWADIGYNFLVGEDGRVYDGRGWSTRGSHAGIYNPKSLGLSFLGSFSSRAPNAAALNAARRLVRCAVSRGYLTKKYILKGHRNVNPTSCPGDALYGVISQWPGFKA